MNELHRSTGKICRALIPSKFGSSRLFGLEVRSEQLVTGNNSSLGAAEFLTAGWHWQPDNTLATPDSLITLSGLSNM